VAPWRLVGVYQRFEIHKTFIWIVAAVKILLPLCHVTFTMLSYCKWIYRISSLCPNHAYRHYASSARTKPYGGSDWPIDEVTKQPLARVLYSVYRNLENSITRMKGNRRLISGSSDIIAETCNDSYSEVERVSWNEFQFELVNYTSIQRSQKISGRRVDYRQHHENVQKDKTDRLFSYWLFLFYITHCSLQSSCYRQYNKKQKQKARCVTM
jgi:hypothetical protein